MSFIDALKSRYDHLAQEAKKFIAPDELQHQRINICNGCEHLFELTRSCKACGCFVDAKVKIISAKCPKEKW